MAEVFGAVVGGVALCGQLVQMGKAIQKAIKRVRHARRDVSDLADETIIFAGLYEKFLHTCADELKGSTGTASPIKRLRSWAEATLYGLEELLEKVKALRRHSSFPETMIAHVEWFFSKSFVDGLRASLSVARQSINGFSNLTHIKMLNDELKELRAALRDGREKRMIEKELGIRLEDKISMVEKEIQITRDVHHTDKKLLYDANRNLTQHQGKSQAEDVVPAADALVDLTKSFEQYAKAVLPSRRSSNRGRSHVTKPASDSTSRSVHSQKRPPTATSTDRKHKPQSLRSNNESEKLTSAARVNLPSSDDSNDWGGSRHPSTTSSWTSNTTPASNRSVKADPAGKSKRMNAAQSEHDQVNADEYIEHCGSRAREYINDPDGTILSPPKLKFSILTPAEKQDVEGCVLNEAEKSGGHMIGIAPAEVFISGYYLLVEDEVSGKAFYEALRKSDKLDSLVQALTDRDEEDREWDEIPGWTIVVRARSGHGNRGRDTILRNPQNGESLSAMADLSTQSRIAHPPNTTFICGHEIRIDGEYLWIDSYQLLPSTTQIRDDTLRRIREDRWWLDTLLIELKLLEKIYPGGGEREVIGWGMNLMIPYGKK